MKKNIKILIAVLSLGIGYVGYLIYRRNNQAPKYVDLYNGDGRAQERSKFWDFAVLSTSAIDPAQYLQLGYVANELPLNSKFAPPLAYSDTAFSSKWRDSNRKNISWVVENYDWIVREIAESLRIPRALIYMILAVESSSTAAVAGYNLDKYRELTGVMSSRPSKALGPAQFMAITATETYQIALTKGLINDLHKEILVDSVGTKRAELIYQRSSETSKYFPNNKVIAYNGNRKELMDDRLNIMLCGLKVAALIDNYGAKNLHQVVYAYNQGDRTVAAYGFAKYKYDNIPGFLEAVKASPKVVAAQKIQATHYVVRCLGQHGALDIIINDLNIIW